MQQVRRYPGIIIGECLKPSYTVCCSGGQHEVAAHSFSQVSADVAFPL